MQIAEDGGEQDRTLRMFRRAKLQLDAVPPEVLDAAVTRGLLVGRLGLTDPHGHPTCASVRPPLIEWIARTAQVSSADPCYVEDAK